MSETITETIQLTQQLIREPSLTPDDANCQAILTERLERVGFTVVPVPAGPVKNFWAFHGSEGPVFAFAGHTDIVPLGHEEDWDYPPFDATITDDGILHGRGAQDMKGAVAAMVTACERFVTAYPNHPGTVALLITSAEEGMDYLNGTPKVLDYLAENQIKLDWCLVGEPSCHAHFGDTIRNGRRGSFKAFLKILGQQGHVAYPHLADNPIHSASGFIHDMTNTVWCEGNDFFPPTVVQCANLRSNTQTINIIPGSLEVWFAYRFSSEVNAETLQEKTQDYLDKHALNYEATWELSGNPFLTATGALLEATIQAIQTETTLTPELSTGGGTSDGRFIAPTGAQVIEFGTRNDTIHKVNERVHCAELNSLSRIYEQVIEELLVKQP